MEIDLEQLRELMAAINDFDLDELEIEQGDQRIFLKRGGHTHAPGIPLVAAAPMVPSGSVPPPPPPAPAPVAAAPAEDPDATYVTSPFVGTFYRSPSPDSGPFVKKGDVINAGQTLCIVEAMKLMNEIEAEFGCEILEVLFEDGKPVEYGEKLFRVKKS